MNKGNKEPELSDVIGGMLNLFGFKIDLAKLLASPEEVREQLEQLRERLKKAGGREALSDEEWRQGEMSISGHVRTRGILGEREYHIGTTPAAGVGRGQARAKRAPEAVEPPLDVFHEAEGITVIAEVPGVELADLEIKVEDDVLTLSTKPTARRSYRKRVDLGSPVDANSLKATCRNGILEVHLRNRAS